MLKRAPRPTADRAKVLSQALSQVAGRLEIGPTEIGQIVGVSQPTASRLLHGSYNLKETGKEWELSTHLVRLYRSLFSLVGGDEALARGWLRSANDAFFGQRPIDVIKRIDGLLNVCDYLDTHRARV
ncbi:DUF2384 domain-containing protein [Azoarcus communis]|uniref:DUF2384 domain-containing protein n=1 Tax=Parazoarcus communis SWub3 = DSM 12120 TaxID=1121029 RepID=A0A323V5H5_9RHOO|nr:antitoxin Xre/MbcA/ParS toxin-binding domain-containing protein [Parazoarcus communis]NMG48206.1 DUF2384 domain-containing protein [Parazoarcus communis]NMG70969.1 DUF2384 domain-containing protein [Parazoarcus communis SWub3 = DSM 12120]PZA15428.1 hypothetical protein DNK49_16970 [Azoarcus communis] [Parazoarcus communis SWub3 = DSM 12120]